MKLPTLLLLLLTPLCAVPAPSPACPRPNPCADQEPPGRAAPLTLAGALSRVFERNPDLLVSELEIEAASARLSQAAVRPNPEISAETENLSVPGFGDGLFHFSENTLQFSQRLEIGGKRSLRVRAAQKEVSVASSNLEVRKADLLAEASKAFAELLTEQERLDNQRELTRLAEQAHAIVLERVAAGKVSPVEQTRAAVALASSRLEETMRRQALTAAGDRLAALWGGSHSDFDVVQGSFAVPEPPALPPDGCFENNPDFKLASANIDARDAALAMEIASKKPDLTVSAGFRHLNPESAAVWVAGISIPIPIFDKREGAIAEARIRLDQSQAAQQALRRRLRSGLTQARHDFDTARLEAEALSGSALPAAREAADALEEGYRLGKFDFLNVLDAQRTYAELKGRYIEAVASALQAAIEIERLTRCEPAVMPASAER